MFVLHTAIRSPLDTGRVCSICVFYSFTGGNDGANAGSVMLATNGMLYGTAPFGGANGKGVLFAFAP